MTTVRIRCTRCGFQDEFVDDDFMCGGWRSARDRADQGIQAHAEVCPEITEAERARNVREPYPDGWHHTTTVDGVETRPAFDRLSVAGR